MTGGWKGGSCCFLGSKESICAASVELTMNDAGGLFTSLLLMASGSLSSDSVSSVSPSDKEVEGEGAAIVPNDELEEGSLLPAFTP